MLPDGLVSTCTYCWSGLALLIVMTPCAPSFQKPGLQAAVHVAAALGAAERTPRSRRGRRSAKLLNDSWFDGNFPFTMAVSAISDLIDEPAFVM